MGFINNSFKTSVLGVKFLLLFSTLSDRISVFCFSFEFQLSYLIILALWVLNSHIGEILDSSRSAAAGCTISCSVL